MAQRYVEKLKDIPLLSGHKNPKFSDKGSNSFVLSGKLTDSGFPLLNNDPHLGLTSPPIWYQIQLNVAKKNKTLLNVTGVSFVGIPGVVLGHNDDIAWSATTSLFDVTDIYVEKIDAQFGNISIIHDGKKEPVVFRDETFRVNNAVDGKMDNIETLPPSADVPARLPSVARRNNGPIIGVDLAGGTALSIQYTGTSPTLELETFLDFNRAKSVKDFQKALEFFDFGAQNFSVATTTGDIAFFSTGELPLREDLEAGKIVGAPPFLLRDGATGNEWIPVKKRFSNQTLAYEILPPEELPQLVNPSAGFIVTANNDPLGTTLNNKVFDRKRATGGILYLAPDYDSGSRAVRLTKNIQEAVASGKKISVEMARRFQADVRMRDAEILMPFIMQAFANAQQPNAPAKLSALANDPGIKEAIERFKTWDFSTPTGLRNGYDSFVPYNQSDPTQQQISASVSTTIYSIWRSQVIRDTLDATLQPFKLQANSFGGASIKSLHNLLVNFAQRKGKGASGLDFFKVADLANSSPEVQRDFVLLQALRKGLDALAGPDFELAFSRSTKQNDYRWGFLHRVAFSSDFGTMSEFSIPSPKSNFQSPLPNLFGLPRDGGVSVPNASGHDVRAKGVNDFMFFAGPSKRSTYVTKPGQVDYVTAVPGGQSGVLNSKFRDNLLNFWLVADVYSVKSSKDQLTEQDSRVLTFKPAITGLEKDK
jgi:penicillin amidase